MWERALPTQHRVWTPVNCGPIEFVYYDEGVAGGGGALGLQRRGGRDFVTLNYDVTGEQDRVGHAI
jgi:hypothetical protein